MMLPFLGAIARNVDLDCMKYFLGLGLIIKVGMSIVGQFTGYSMPIEYYGTAEPPVRCGESHLSGLTEPLHFVY